jgi:hypothetical protein
MKQRNFLSTICLPMILIGLIAICFGLPLNSWSAFLALSFAAVASLVGTIRTDCRIWAIACVAALACVIVRTTLPTHAIDEGHSIFSSDPQGPLAAALPASIFTAMRRLQQKLPRSYDQEPPHRAWAFSADGIWNPSTLSRSRKDIDFDDRWSLRIGAMNDVAYSDRRKGRYLPLVFRFDLPETTKRGRLCWTGTLFWPHDRATYEEITATETECRAIPQQFARRDRDEHPVFTVYAVDFDRDRPLTMRLDHTGLRGYAPTIAAVVSIVGAVAVIILLVRVRAAAIAAWALATTSIVAYMAQRFWRGEPPGFSGLPFMGRGNDGLTYYSSGRAILGNVVQGDWSEAFHGGIDVFYFSPGMRYVWAGLTSVFGESFFGYFIVIVIIPFLVLHLLRAYMSPKSAILLFWCFLLLPIFEALGFLYWYYVKLAVRGFGGGVAWCALFAAVLILVRRLDVPNVRQGGLLAAGLLLALAISCRPNLAIGVFVLVAGTTVLLLRDARFTMPVRLWHSATLGLGAAAIFAVAFHNWYYGGVFVPLTNAWKVKANLELPPSSYVDAAAAILTGDPLWTDKVWRVLKHLRGWINYYEFWLIIPYITLWVALFRRDLNSFIRILAASLLANHAVFLFYPSFPRYNYGIWLLTFLVFTIVLRRVYWPAAKHRCPRLATIREPSWMRYVANFDVVTNDEAREMPRPAIGLPATGRRR